MSLKPDIVINFLCTKASSCPVCHSVTDNITEDGNII